MTGLCSRGKVVVRPINRTRTTTSRLPSCAHNLCDAQPTHNRSCTTGGRGTKAQPRANAPRLPVGTAPLRRCLGPPTFSALPPRPRRCLGGLALDAHRVRRHQPSPGADSLGPSTAALRDASARRASANTAKGFTARAGAPRSAPIASAPAVRNPLDGSRECRYFPLRRAEARITNPLVTAVLAPPECRS